MENMRQQNPFVMKMGSLWNGSAAILPQRKIKISEMSAPLKFQLLESRICFGQGYNQANISKK